VKPFTKSNFVRCMLLNTLAELRCEPAGGGRQRANLLPGAHLTMTREEYGSAYKVGYNLTVRFLVSRGLTYDSARETAQAAWVKGWERLGQLRDPNMVLTWMNSIALNIHRSYMRREPFSQTLPEIATPPKINLAAIDVRRILKTCKKNDRMVLQRHYLEGYKVQEIARAHGWTETAVRIRLLRARRAVHKRFAA